MDSHHTLVQSLQYLEEVLETRLQPELGQESDYEHIGEIPPPPIFEDDQAPFTRFLLSLHCNRSELIVLMLALAPHLLPNWLDSVLKNILKDKPVPPQLGLVKGKDYQGLMSTGQTALFILAGNNVERRWQIQALFDEEHFFAKEKILYLEGVNQGEPAMSAKIRVEQDYVDLFTRSRITRPRFSPSFPAQYIETEMNWEDLILHPQTEKQIIELNNWLVHNNTFFFDWGMKKKYKLGYRVLFHGPPGTGKTLTATLLGKATGRDVYKVDLSLVVSKYIGETEKNLSHLFDKAENKGWILFFDEADALFGKRTNVKDAHDKYANQEVSFLLQRVENYNGLVILASNFRSNIDDAFLRRFQAIIHFPMPGATERLQIWQRAFPDQLPPDKDVDLKSIAQKYELSGSSIMNIVQFGCLSCIAQKADAVHLDVLQLGIQREFHKYGKIL